MSRLYRYDKFIKYVFGNYSWGNNWAIITWWIFNTQKKTSDKQDYTLNRIEQLERYNEEVLEKILDLNKKIDSLLED